MIDQLKQQIQGVAKLRQEYAQAKAQRVKEYEQWQNDHDDIFRAEHDLGELVANAEADLRSLILQVYALTGNKTPQAYCPDCQDFESCGKKRYKEAEYHHPCYYFYPPKALFEKYGIKEKER